jgi:hypothetical protein
MLSLDCFQRTAARLARARRARKPIFCAACVIGPHIREYAKTMNDKGLARLAPAIKGKELLER